MIHQYKLNGYNIVLDVNSGAVHVVDDVAYDIIAAYETTPRAEIVRQMMTKYVNREDVNEAEIAQCIDDVEALRNARKLFSEDRFRDAVINFKENNACIKALCLHVAHTCNLNCAYCFASQGKYHGDRALMSFETGRRALDFLIENSAGPAQPGS